MKRGWADAFAARHLRLGLRFGLPGRVGYLLALALVVSACTPARTETAAPDPVVRVGAVVSLTGPAHLFGAAQRSGIKLAQDEINASHMLGKTRLDILVEDDASDREQASAVFQKFIENGRVVALLGPTLSDTALSVDPLAQQAGVSVLSISNAAGGITQIGNFIFRVCLTESQLTPRIIKTLRSQMKLHTAALLYSDTDPNRAGSQGFKKALQDLGIGIAAEQVFTSDQTDFSSQLDAIAASRPDALFITAPSHSAAAVLVQARQHGLSKLPIIGSSAFNSDTVLRSAGDAAEGLIVGSAWSAASTSPRNQKFIQNYHARFGVNPDQLAAQAYTGVYVLATALRDSGAPNDRRAVRDALERIHGLDTPMGSFSFNDARDATYPPTVQVVHNGQFQLFGLP
jgi:branched-chain amino acid transport system substrate-binding protein